LVQAAILHEAQQRGTYRERNLEAIARRFDIGLRQGEKYALDCKVFFSRHVQEEYVNIDAILLDEPSWYVVAATETADPEKWLGFDQDHKQEGPRYSVATFRRDMQVAGLLTGLANRTENTETDALSSMLEHRTCPWIKWFCTRSGKPVLVNDCQDYEIEQICETNPTSPEVAVWPTTNRS
jgi:hypothetical protein